jgi:hypothetical protein
MPRTKQQQYLKRTLSLLGARPDERAFKKHAIDAAEAAEAKAKASLEQGTDDAEGALYSWNGQTFVVFANDDEVTTGKMSLIDDDRADERDGFLVDAAKCMVQVAKYVATEDLDQHVEGRPTFLDGKRMYGATCLLSDVDGLPLESEFRKSAQVVLEKQVALARDEAEHLQWACGFEGKDEDIHESGQDEVAGDNYDDENLSQVPYWIHIKGDFLTWHFAFHAW